LKAVFNKAIREKDIPSEIYPFGRDRYQIPAAIGVKKALSMQQLNTLYHAKPCTPEQEKAKDFWFFSFACNGMNIKDIALLKHENLTPDTLTYYRAKTINNPNIRPIVIHINNISRAIIRKYGTGKKYVFPIFNAEMNEFEKHRCIKNFTRVLNQGIKKLAIANDLPGEISTYWARHSFATVAINKGMSMEFVSEALSHSNIKTTQGYFAGFESKTKKEFSDKLAKWLE